MNSGSILSAVVYHSLHSKHQQNWSQLPRASSRLASRLSDLQCVNQPQFQFARDGRPERSRPLEHVCKLVNDLVQQIAQLLDIEITAKAVKFCL